MDERVGAGMKEKITTHTLLTMKNRGEKITALTCYNYYLSRILNQARIDVILVGDSLGMVELGYESTLPVTMEEMLCHVKAVKRGNSRALLVADMPYMSYNFSRKGALLNAGRLIKEGGAEAVKIEGGKEVRKTIEDFFAHNIPVMGHVGLTPQAINRFGGYRVQGKEAHDRERIFKEAELLEKYGVFSLVLECVPEDLAASITENLKIPVIGIGAGRKCDGQILVLNDILGLYPGLSPRFVKKYAHLQPTIAKAVQRYRLEVKKGKYPAKKHIYA